MAKLTKEQRVVRQIIKEHGERLNLRTDPNKFLEIVRSLRITDYLLSQGAALIVVACNTATAAAIEAMRQQHPKLPLVGVEPGVKPAAQRSLSKRVGVMATTIVGLIIIFKRKKWL